MRARLRIAASAVVVFATRLAGAQDVDAARAAYDRGTRAMEASDYPTAAREFQTADELAPNFVALRWAIVAASEANDAELAMNLTQRAEGRAPARALSEAVTSAKSRFSTRVGRLVLRCAPRQACSARVNGNAFPTEGGRFVTPGTHAVEFVVGERVDRAMADVKAEATVTLTASPLREAGTGAAPPLPVERRSGHAGVAPAWISIGAVGTAAVAGATIWSAVDTLAVHDAYLASRDRATYDEGRAAELRTNVLIGATGASALVTVLFAALAVDYGKDDSPGRAFRPLLGATASASAGGLFVWGSF